MSEVILDTFAVDSLHIDRVGKAIEKHFREKLYQPLMSLLDEKSKTKKLQNATYDLLMAIHKGRVTYYRGKFTGKFNAQISKELKAMGAKWSAKKGGSFNIPKNKLPRNIFQAIKTSEAEWKSTSERISKKIDEIAKADIAESLNLKGIIDDAIIKMDTDFQKTIKGVTIAPELTKKNIEDIAQNYTENMRYYISDFADQEIERLRKKVQESTFKGVRYEHLAKEIQVRYGVSKSKATFLARQETNLLLAKFKESRYDEIGADEYIWQTVIGSPAHPVREGHAKLNGTRQSFKNPPIVNERGDRKNPGEDYNCRCRAKPIIKF